MSRGPQIRTAGVFIRRMPSDYWSIRLPDLQPVMPQVWWPTHMRRTPSCEAP